MGFKQISSDGVSWLVSWTWCVCGGGMVIYAFNNTAVDTIIASLGITFLLFVATWVLSKVV